jgi:flagellar biosynthesis/type III secretory pathway protein FliH
LAWKWRDEGIVTGLEKGRVEGIMTGLEKGRAEGRAEGVANGAQCMLLKQLAQRFGALPSWAQERVCMASMDELELISERMLRKRSLKGVLGK